MAIPPTRTEAQTRANKAAAKRRAAAVKARQKEGQKKRDLAKKRSPTDMNCWTCKTELIWGGDHDIDPEEDDSPFCMVSNFSCATCQAYVEFYVPRELEI